MKGISNAFIQPCTAVCRILPVAVKVWLMYHHLEEYEIQKEETPSLHAPPAIVVLGYGSKEIGSREARDVYH